jgi:hypothetical protein
MVLYPSLRLIPKAGSILLLWLLSVSFGMAMPLRHPPPRLRDASTTTLKKLVHQARRVGGPLAKKRVRSFGIRLHPQPSRIRHDIPRLSHDEDQAIQNDTAAAEISGDLQIGLEPAGSFVDTASSAAATRTFSPRIPRGPPTRPDMVQGHQRFRQIEVVDEGASRRSEV